VTNNQQHTDGPKLINPTLHTAVIAAFETAINKALTLDPATQKKLTTLQHHCFHLHCTAPELDFYLIPGENEVRLCAWYDAKADTRLVGSAKEFAKLLTAADPANSLINSSLELHGDSNALISLQHIARELDLDWEAPLASVFGDVIGHQMGKGIRKSFAFGKQLFNGLRRQIDDYIVEESDSVPAQWQVQKFFNDVDQLAMRTERIAAKIARLSKHSPLK
jgi:ubiquinone biosynthesis accessory factor UbiJ